MDKEKKIIKQKKPTWTWAIPVGLALADMFILGEGMWIGLLVIWFFGNVTWNKFEEKGRNPVYGYWLGFFLGLIGFIIACCLRKKK